VYLFAASQGLACWFHNCDRVALRRALKLRRGQRVLFAQSVGYPAGAKRRVVRVDAEPSSARDRAAPGA